MQSKKIICPLRINRMVVLETRMEQILGQFIKLHPHNTNPTAHHFVKPFKTQHLGLRKCVEKEENLPNRVTLFLCVRWGDEASKEWMDMDGSVEGENEEGRKKKEA